MVKKIALMGQERIDWVRLRGRAAQKVRTAIKKGLLPNLKKQEISCVDCRNKATMYHHEDYTKALEVTPVCDSCNIIRGTNAPTIPQDKKRIRCPDCKSLHILYKKKTNTFWCRRCGHEWPKKNKMKKINERHKIVRDLLLIMTERELAPKAKVSVSTIISWSLLKSIPPLENFYLLKRIHKQKIG